VITKFGARSRDYGYWPSTRESINKWYSQTLETAERLASSDDSSAAKVRKAIADELRGLWTGAAMYDELERVCRSIAEKGFWTEGLIAVRQTIHYDSNASVRKYPPNSRRLRRCFNREDLVQECDPLPIRDCDFVGVDATDNGTDIQKILARVDAMAYELGRPWP